MASPNTAPRGEDPAARHEAMKSRIITHMNSDHSYELSLYLRAFNGVSVRGSQSPRIVDLSLRDMTIATSRSGRSHHIVAFRSSSSAGSGLQSLAEARPALVAMAGEAQRKLGVSEFRVKGWTAPRGGGIVSAVGVASYFLAVLTLPWVAERGSTGWRVMDRVWDGPLGGADMYVWIVRTIFWPVMLIHLTEAWWMARTRLYQHGVDAWTGLWWAWVLNTFVEGAPAFFRFDGLVEEQRRKKEGAKH